MLGSVDINLAPYFEQTAVVKTITLSDLKLIESASITVAISTGSNQETEPDQESSIKGVCEVNDDDIVAMIDQIWKNNELSREEGLTLEQAMPIVEDYMESLNIDVGSAGQEAILKNFAELDLDGNGQIDRDEMFRHLKKTKNLSSMIAENKANSQEQIEDRKIDEGKADVAQAEEKLPSEEEKVIVTESTQDPSSEYVPVKEKVEENETPVGKQENQVTSAQSTKPVVKVTLDSSVKRRSGIVGQVLPGQVDHNKQTTDTAQVARLQYEVANCLEQM